MREQVPRAHLSAACLPHMQLKSKIVRAHAAREQKQRKRNLTK